MGIFSDIADRLDMMQNMFRQTGALKEAGFSPDQANSLREATMRCVKCGHGEACQNWLDEGDKLGLEDRQVPDFCPNQGLQNKTKTAKG